MVSTLHLEFFRNVAEIAIGKLIHSPFLLPSQCYFI